MSGLAVLRREGVEGEVAAADDGAGETAAGVAGEATAPRRPPAALVVRPRVHHHRAAQHRVPPCTLHHSSGQQGPAGGTE